MNNTIEQIRKSAMADELQKMAEGKSAEDVANEKEDINWRKLKKRHPFVRLSVVGTGLAGLGAGGLLARRLTKKLHGPLLKGSILVGSALSSGAAAAGGTHFLARHVDPRYKTDYDKLIMGKKS